MLKVVATVDKVNTAIDRLAQGLVPYMKNINYVVCDVHPKKPSPEQLERFVAEVRDADIVDFQYWKTATMLLERYSWLEDKKKVVTMYNPYSITESDWSQFDEVVACNKTIQERMLKSTYIPLTVDANFWTYKDQLNTSGRVIMVANRIESKKGILEVATACGNLGLTFVLVGAISDRNYFNDILQTGNVEFHEQITDEALRDLYYSSTIHACNSVDNFESGTLPILESMFCGVPVLTRKVGHVPDMDDGTNFRILDSDPENVEAIQAALEGMLSDPAALIKQRESAWQTVKIRNNERRAYEWQRLYRSLTPGESVSVIVPIYDKPETIRACLNAIADQDYPNLEIIACNDNNEANWSDLVANFAQTVSFPVRYLDTSNDWPDYGLARARNFGIVEATGNVLVFCDQRQIMQPGCITELVNHLEPGTWVYGNKGGNKQNFVENLSAVYRQELIYAGMFCERMDGYGGLTQETRNRTRNQGTKHVYVESAKAVPMGKSSNRNRKRLEIVESKTKLWKMGL